jgi:hypothetical protein
MNPIIKSKDDDRLLVNVLDVENMTIKYNQIADKNNAYIEVLIMRSAPNTRYYIEKDLKDL